MKPGPTIDEARAITEKLEKLVEKEECWSCDCLQGLLTQLELDSPDDLTRVTESLKTARNEMHGCLGCDPCPPAELFAEYIRSRMQ